MNAKKVLRAPLFWALMMLVLFMLVFRMGSGGEYARIDTSAAEQLVDDGKVEEAHFTSDNTLQLDLKEGQTYSDGEVADWSDVAEEGGDEPEHPAPSFEVTEAQEGGHHATPEDAGREISSSDTLARTLGGLALVVALLGAGVAVVGRRKA